MGMNVIRFVNKMHSLYNMRDALIKEIDEMRQEEAYLNKEMGRESSQPKLFRKSLVKNSSLVLLERTKKAIRAREGVYNKAYKNYIDWNELKIQADFELERAAENIGDLNIQYSSLVLALESNISEDIKQRASESLNVVLANLNEARRQEQRARARLTRLENRNPQALKPLSEVLNSGDKRSIFTGDLAVIEKAARKVKTKDEITPIDSSDKFDPMTEIDWSK